MTNGERLRQCLLHPDVQAKLDSTNDPVLGEVMKRVLDDDNGDYLAALLTIASLHVAATRDIGTFILTVAMLKPFTDQIPGTEPAKEAAS